MQVTPLPSQINAANIAPDRLADNPNLTQHQKIAEASRQFEAILLRQILASTQQTMIKSSYTDNSTSAGIYQDMITNQLADNISKTGVLGLAKVFEQQLEHPAPAASKAGTGTAGSVAPLTTARPAATARPHFNLSPAPNVSPVQFPPATS